MSKHRTVLTRSSFLGLGLLALAQGGCRSARAAGRRAVELTVWTMWTGAEEANFRAVLDRYEALNPGVRVRNLGAVRDDSKTVRAIVAGDSPDLFLLADALNLGPLAANDALLPLDDRLRAAGLSDDDFIPAALRLCRLNGRLYGLPFLIDCYALLWNKAVFRDAGLDPERPPATMEEWGEMAVRLTKARGGKLERVGLEPYWDPNVFGGLFGGRLMDETGRRATPDSPENLKGLEWYGRLMQRMGGYEAVNGFAAGFGQMQSATNPFYMGQVAMTINGEWNPWWCRKYAPDLEYGVAPLPHPADRPDLARTTWLGGNIFCIPRAARHPDAAWDLLLWMQSPEAQVLFASKMNNVPNRRSALGEPSLREGEEYKRKFAIFLDLAATGRPAHFPVTPVSNLYNAELTSGRDLTLTGAKTARQAMRDVRLRVQRELDRSL
jgi:ABC-type glycerol-3-phosphate transport system substrate-binding protein